jgi:hypothetical protein
MASTMMAQNEVQDYGCNTRNGIVAHYDYAPFAAVTRAISASSITDNTFITANPFRFPSPDGLGRIFSSEYHDDTLGLVYYRERERTLPPLQSH